jgi:hypothetical protein
MQEIMAKFNKGYLRAVNFTSKMPLSYNEINDTKVYATYSAPSTPGTPGTPGVVGNSDTPPGSESVISDSQIVSVDTVKVVNNKVPIKGTKDDKGNLSFKDNEKLVIIDNAEGGDRKPAFSYTYVKNKDGGFTEYKYDIKNKKNESKIIEAGTADANKLSNMFDSGGTVLADAQKSMKGIDKNGISGVTDEKSKQAKKTLENSKKVDDTALTNSNKSLAKNPDLVPGPYEAKNNPPTTPGKINLYNSNIDIFKLKV